MSSELEPQGAPPELSFWRLGWLLFLQPFAFHELFLRWDIESPPLHGLIRQSRAGNPVARRFLASAGLYLLFLMPAASALLAVIVNLLGFGVSWKSVAGSVAGGLVGGIAVSLYSVRAGVRYGCAFGVCAALALGLFGEPLGNAAAWPVLLKMVLIFAAVVAAGLFVLGILFRDKDTTDGERASVLTLKNVGEFVGVTIFGALAFGALVALTFYPAFWVSQSSLSGVPLGALIGLVSGVLLVSLDDSADLGFLIPLAVSLGVTLGYEAGIAAGVAIAALRLVPSLGMKSFLMTILSERPEFGKAVLSEVLSSDMGKTKDAAIAAVVEFVAQDLEKAAADRSFRDVADMDFKSFQDFGPALGEKALAYGSPLHVFLMAARDLVSGGVSHRRRLEANKRAREKMSTFMSSAPQQSSDPLYPRLRTTAGLWIKALDEEARTIEEQILQSPEVPTAFIAGTPLDPEKSEQRQLFKGRDDLVKLIEHDLAPDRRGVLLLFGQRRMGKTSLRNWLQFFFGTDTTVLPIDFQRLSGDIYRENPHLRILEVIGAAGFSAPPPPDSPRWGEGLRWLEEIDRTLTSQQILVVIDEVERVEDGIRAGFCNTDFLDFIRAAGDSLHRIRFLLLTAYPLHRLGPHWVDRLVSATSRSISYLDEAAARDLVVHPVSDFPDIYPDGGVERILQVTGRHPFLIQKVCDELCRLLNKRGGRRKADDAELTEVLDLVIAQVDLFDELWHQRTEEEKHALRKLASAKEPLEPDPVARQLVREGYLIKRDDKVEIAVPLFREWIAETQGGA